MSKAKPSGHTSQKIDHIAAKLMHSPKLNVRAVAGAALSDTRTTAKGPVAHTSAKIASAAASLMHTGTKQERSLAASVLADHKTRTGK